MFLRNPDIVCRRVHDTAFLINICDNYSNDKCTLYKINSIGEFIWNHLDECDDVDELSNIVHKTITDDIEYSVIYNDVNEFVSILSSMKFAEVG